MGAQLFYFLLFFPNLLFTQLFFVLLKNIPCKYCTLTCLLPFFLSGKVELAALCNVVQFTVRFCTSVMVKCMEKAHSGYTNHHLLLLFSRSRGVFSLEIHCMCTLDQNRVTHSFIFVLPLQSQRGSASHPQRFMGRSTHPGRGFRFRNIVRCFTRGQNISWLGIVLFGMAQAKIIKGWFRHFWKGE